MAASKPKRSVKQPLNPDFVYDFPAMVFPSDCDPNSTPSAAAPSAAQVPATMPAVTGTVPVAKKKSTKSAKIQDQLELERLKNQNLQLELKLISQKEVHQTTQDKMSSDTRGQLLHDQSQEKFLALLLNDLTHRRTRSRIS